MTISWQWAYLCWGDSILKLKWCLVIETGTLHLSHWYFNQNRNWIKFVMCLFITYLADHNEIFHTSRQLHCRNLGKTTLWSVQHSLNQSTLNFDQISNLIKIPLVGWVPGLLVSKNWEREKGIQGICSSIIRHTRGCQCDNYQHLHCWQGRCLDDMPLQNLLSHSLKSTLTTDYISPSALTILTHQLQVICHPWVHIPSLPFPPFHLQVTPPP